MPLITCFHTDVKYKSRKSANQSHVDLFPTNIGLKGMRYYGAKLWNHIFSNFTDVNSIDSFKSLFKDMITICFGRENVLLYLMTRNVSL